MLEDISVEDEKNESLKFEPGWLCRQKKVQKIRTKTVFLYRPETLEM